MKKLNFVKVIFAAVCLGGVYLIMTGNAIVSAEDKAELLLEPKPLTPDDVLTTLDVVSKQGRLGDGGDVPVIEGRVTVGRPVVYAQALTAPEKNKLIVPNGERFYLVQFPFTLHPLPERQCTKLKFSVTVTTPSSLAHKLIPDRVTTAEEGTQTDELGFSISIPRVGAEGSAKTTNTVKYVRLSPVITSYGLRERNFYWVFKGPRGDAVEDGAKVVAAVVQVPRDTKNLKVTLGWRVDWQRRMFDAFRSIPAVIRDQSIEINLQ